MLVVIGTDCMDYHTIRTTTTPISMLLKEKFPLKDVNIPNNDHRRLDVNRIVIIKIKTYVNDSFLV
jgi:hypothetical protein